MWANFHCHSTFCDGKNSIGEMILSAMQKRMVSIGISSHAPLPFNSAWCMKSDRLPEYIKELQEYKRYNTVLEIYKGLEVDFIPGIISPAQFKSPLDYTIGSIHFVDQFADGRRWEIDGTHAFFREGLEKIFQGNAKDVIVRYFELTRQMIEDSKPDILGHLDKIKIQNSDNQLFNESDTWYQQEVAKVLDAAEKNGTIIEVNTRGIYQKKSQTTYPSPWILEQIFKHRIPITLSSDAHHESDLCNQFAETAITLNRIGFKKICILSGGRWQHASFDEHGITKTIAYYPVA